MSLGFIPRHGEIDKTKASLVAQTQESWVPSLDQEDALKKGMATHSSILAWEVPRTEEPGRLQSMGCKELDTTD